MYSVPACVLHITCWLHTVKKKNVPHVLGIVYLWMRLLLTFLRSDSLTGKHLDFSQTPKEKPPQSLLCSHMFFFLFVSSLLFFLHTNFPFLFFFLPPTTNLHFRFFSFLLSPSHLYKLHLNVFPLFCIFQPGFAAETAGWLTANFQCMN